MGIDKGNAAEQSIAKELYILNKKLDRLIDILANSKLAKNDYTLKVNEEGIAMVPVWQRGKTTMVPIDQVKIEER